MFARGDRLRLTLACNLYWRLRFVTGLLLGVALFGAVTPVRLRRLCGMAVFDIAPALQSSLLAFTFFNIEDAKIMLGMLKHVLGRYPIPGGVGITRELQVFLIHLIRVTANANAGTVAVETLMAWRRITTPTAAATGPLGTLPLSHITVMNC